MISNEVLKNKILDDAMHGLLVKNSTKNSIDELNEIITTNKNKSNKKDLSTFSLENPHSIPDNWNWVELGKIVEINLGFTHTPKYVSDGVKFLSVKDISSGYIDFNNVKYVSEEEYNTAPYGAKPHKGDILFGRVGTIGVPQIIETDDKFCIFVSLGFLRDFSNKLNKKFICYWMYSNTFKNQVYHVVKGAAQINLNTKWLQSFLIPFPPLEEQEEIVKKVDELFELIDRKEKNDIEKEKLKEILKSKILRNAFCGELIDNNDSLESIDNEEFKGEVPFKIPSNWKWCEYKSIGDSGIGLTYRPENVSDDGIIVLRSSNIQNGKLDLKDIVRVNCKVNENIIVKENDILICARNGSKRLVGKSCLLVDMKERMTYGAFMTIFRTPYFKYVYWFMQSRYYYNQLYENTNTMTINQVTQKKLNSLIIPLPPLEEQKRIVEKIESLFELIEQL